MCGIAGIIDLRKNNKYDLHKKVGSMIKKINHRGPDYNSIFQNSIGCFGFARLSIIDLSEKSHQPFQSVDKKVSVIYNGEIYNYKKLKDQFFKNDKFLSNGDGEIILHLYNKFGINFISKLKGMFAICIVDLKINKVYLIRDRFGIKPIYFYQEKQNNIIYFASEIISLFSNKEIAKELNYKEAYRYFKQGLVNCSSETWFKNVYQIKPSYFLEISNTEIKEKKYYSLEENIDEEEDKKGITFKKYIEDFKEKLLVSFDEHNQFDVSCGVHLSGGSDSAVLAALCNYRKKNYISYTFDFEDKRFSELDLAKKISESANLRNQSSKLLSKNINDYLDKVLIREFEPFSSLRILSSHYLYDTYKNEAKVILDGNGGDEIGAGYNYHIAPWYMDLSQDKNLKNLNKRLKKNITHIAGEENINPIESKLFRGSIAHFNHPGSSTADGSYYRNDDVLNQDFSEKFDFAKKFKKPFQSKLRNAQYLDLFYLKIPRTLKYVDRASMYNSVETRVPFLDHELVESAFKIPSKFKLLNKQQRIILKYPFRNYVNKSLLFKNKKSIADPQSHWLKNNLSKTLLSTINENNFNEHGIFEKSEVSSYFEKFLKHKGHFNSFLIFQVFIFELWYQKIFKKLSEY